MKNYKPFLLMLACLVSLSSFGQTSKKTLNYQAVILDPKAIDIPGANIVGQPLNKGNVCLRFSLLNAEGGLDYEETQSFTTDEYGLVNVAIGAGAQAQTGNSTSIYKSFENIVWNASVKSLKVSVSYDGCSSFKQVSSQALNYTPYALYAESVDYKNVRDAPTKLSQFTNDAGFLLPKDLDPLKADIISNTSQLATANQTIADNKKSSDAAFLIVNKSITSLDAKVAENTMAIEENTNSITTINTKITDQQNQISDNRNQINATSNSLNTQIGSLQGQINTTNSTVINLTGTAEVVSNKSTSVNLGGANPSDQAYPSQKAAKSYIDNAIYDAVGSGVPDATSLAAGKVKLAGDLGGTAASPTVPALANKENTSNKSTNVQTDASSDSKFPSVKAVKTYVDQATMGTALAADLANKANIASPTFTGTPSAPTPTSTDNSTNIATTAFVQAAIAATNIASDGTITSGSGAVISVEKGGTGATTASAARTNLGLVIGTNVQAPLVAGTDYLVPTGSAASLTNFPTFNQNTTGTSSNITEIVLPANGGTGLSATGTDGQVLTSTNSGTLTWTGTHYIGESYGGGKVFFVYDNGKHGLIAASSDQSNAIRWFGGSNTNTRARGNGVGAGLKNTAIIIANQGPVDGNAFAATICNEYYVTETVGLVTTTYGDWYLPSKHELNLLYLKKSVVGGFANWYYWSSTELESGWSSLQYFANGVNYRVNKNLTYAVRAIRAF
jgi:hypothetical protein